MSKLAKSWDAIDKDEIFFARSIAARRADLKQHHSFWVSHATELENHGVLWGAAVAVKCLPPPAPLAPNFKALTVH
jgi:hypothetical protein